MEVLYSIISIKWVREREKEENFNSSVSIKREFKVRNGSVS